MRIGVPGVAMNSNNLHAESGRGYCCLYNYYFFLPRDVCKQIFVNELLIFSDHSVLLYFLIISMYIYVSSA